MKRKEKRRRKKINKRNRKVNGKMKIGKIEKRADNRLYKSRAVKHRYGFYQPFEWSYAVVSPRTKRKFVIVNITLRLTVTFRNYFPKIIKLQIHHRHYTKHPVEIHKIITNNCYARFCWLGGSRKFSRRSTFSILLYPAISSLLFWNV